MCTQPFDPASSARRSDRRPALDAYLVYEQKADEQMVWCISSDEAFLDEQQENIIASLYKFKNAYGLASLEFSTGRFCCNETHELGSILSELARIRPVELVLPEVPLLGEKYAYI